MRHDSKTITQAIQMYYQGMSVRDIADNFEMMRISINYSFVYDWIAKYSRIVSDYLKNVVLKTNDRTMVRDDEIWIKGRAEVSFCEHGR